MQRLSSQPLAELANRSLLCCMAEPTDSLDAQLAPLPEDSDGSTGDVIPLEPRDDDVSRHCNVHDCRYYVPSAELFRVSDVKMADP